MGRRREEAKKKREAEAAEAEQKEAAEEVKKSSAGSKAKKVELPTPTQKEVKSALIKLQDSAGEDFQKKWKLKGLSGNKLAKMKYADFMKIWEDFVANGSDAEHREYAA